MCGICIKSLKIVYFPNLNTIIKHSQWPLKLTSDNYSKRYVVYSNLKLWTFFWGQGEREWTLVNPTSAAMNLVVSETINLIITLLFSAQNISGNFPATLLKENGML